MPRLSINLLPSTAAELDNSPKDVIGEKYKGNGYFGFGDGLHTVAQYITGFVGKMEIQGTLAKDPTEDDWVIIATVDSPDELTPVTDSSSYNFYGNYVWVRAKVIGITHGTINKIQLNY